MITLYEILNLGRQRYKTFGKFYKKCLIYKLTNLTNNKVYIGQTTNLSKRLKSYLYHGRTGFGQQPVHRALKKYGLDKFSFEIIEETLYTLLDDREKYWIKEFGSFFKENGYNLTLGGVKFKWSKENIEKRRQKAKNKKPVFLYHKDGSFFCEFHSMNECAAFFKVKHCTIWSAINKSSLLLKKYLLKFEFTESVEPHKNLKGEKISKKLQGNRNCKTFIWRLEDLKNNKVYEEDGIRKLSISSGYSVDVLRSLAYDRSGYLEFKKFLNIKKINDYSENNSRQSK